MDEGRCVLFFAALINRRALSLKRIEETSSQRHNLRLPGAVNQRAWLRPPSHWDSDGPESSQCLAQALACNESAKQGYPEWRNAAGQGVDEAPAGRYRNQGLTPSASTSMRGWAVGQEASIKHLRIRTSVLKRGWDAWAVNLCQVESRRPLRGVFRRLIAGQGPS